jgi:hypothetical protein
MFNIHKIKLLKQLWLNFALLKFKKLLKKDINNYLEIKNQAKNLLDHPIKIKVQEKNMIQLKLFN